MWLCATMLAMAGQQVVVYVDGRAVIAEMTMPLPSRGDALVTPVGTRISEERFTVTGYASLTGSGGPPSVPYNPATAQAPSYSGATPSYGVNLPPSPSSSSSYSPPAQTYTPAPTYTPPAQTYTPAPTYTPPAQTYTPPAQTYTPPAQTYTPPTPTYTPPATPSQASTAWSQPNPTAWSQPVGPSPGTTAAVGTSTAAPPTMAPPPLNPAAKSQAQDLLMRGFPGDPGAECKPPVDALRQQARKQVDLGDEARLGQDVVNAAKDYLAALSMDSCNGFAWLGLGETSLMLGRPDLSVRALRNATKLMPNHTLAWTHLGQQYEALGQRDLAVEAYWTALSLSPNIPEARAGLARLGASEKKVLPPASTTIEPEDDW